jgi:hypothetical protein
MILHYLIGSTWTTGRDRYGGNETQAIAEARV